ncbi:MAG: hypothetical protein Q8O89_06030 [Nanoarchaeota archaeon]|nr:hypothetical protein [Nanoarchaeota archaeon]
MGIASAEFVLDCYRSNPAVRPSSVEAIGNVYDCLLNNLDIARQQESFSQNSKPNVYFTNVSYENGRMSFSILSSVNTRRALSFRDKSLITLADEVKDAVLLFEGPLRNFFPNAKVSNHFAKPLHLCLHIDYAVSGDDSASYTLDVQPGSISDITGNIRSYLVAFRSRQNHDSDVQVENSMIFHKIMASGNARLSLETKVDYYLIKREGSKQ